jgi:hypothetical protein
MSDPYALTTLANVQAYLGTHADDTTLLARLIEAASGEIEHFCQRNFVSRDYLAWLDGIGARNEDMAPYLGYVQWPDSGHHRAMWLPNYPITALRRCCVDRRDCLTIVNTSPDAAYAVISASATALTLIVAGGASAGNSSLLFAAYTTIATLAAAINALGSNWSATIPAGASPWPSREIRPVMSAGCLNAAYTLDCAGSPVQDLEVDETSGRIWRQAGWPQGKRNIFVDYTGGFTTVPAEIEQICIEMVKRLLDDIEGDQNLKDQTFGGLTWHSKSIIERGADLQSALALHRRIIL